MEDKMGLIFLVAAGLFSITASILDWNWFFEHRKARFFVNLIGRTGTRIFYIALGIVLIILGFRV